MIRAYPRHAINLDPSSYLTYLQLARYGELVEGDEIFTFEKAFAAFTGAASCVAVSAARAGFYLTMKAMGIGPGDEVIMPAYTFPSMPAAVVATGARPIFVDVEAGSYNIDAELAEKAVTEKTRAIVAAHLFGAVANVERLLEITRGRGIKLIEDCAHSAGAVKDGRRVGSFGDAAVFSFGIGKNMPCFGGGMIAFADSELAGKVRRLVNASPPTENMAAHKKVLGSIPAFLGTRRIIFGWTLYVAARVLASLGSDAMDKAVREPIEKTTRFSLRSLGRMMNVQAVVGLAQLKKLPERNAVLARNGRYLVKLLEDIEGVVPPAALENEEHIYLYFRILVNDATRFRALLLRRGIDTQSDDMANCAGLAAFGDYAADCPVAAGLPERSIEIPNNASMTKGDLDYIASSVREVAANMAGKAGAEGA